MKDKIKKRLGTFIYHLLIKHIPEFNSLHLEFLRSEFSNSFKDDTSKLYPIYKVYDSNIGAYTYLAQNAKVNNTTIGRFCSIGPNLISGWAIHPINALSTSPMFYSILKQNGKTYFYYKYQLFVLLHKFLLLFIKS